MKKPLFIFIVILLTGNLASAQVDPVGQFNKHIVENWNGEYVRVSQYKVKGTPYLFGESFSGILEYRGGVKNHFKILYDLYNQKAGAEVKNSIFESDLILDKFVIFLPIKFGGDSLMFKNVNYYGDNQLKGYFNVITEGKNFSLLKFFKIKLLPDPSNSLDKEVKIFEQYYEHYLYNNATKDLNRIKLKKKDIIKLTSNEQFIEDFIEKESLDITQEADMTKLIRKLNE